VVCSGAERVPSVKLISSRQRIVVNVAVCRRRWYLNCCSLRLEDVLCCLDTANGVGRNIGKFLMSPLFLNLGNRRVIIRLPWAGDHRECTEDKYQPQRQPRRPASRVTTYNSLASRLKRPTWHVWLSRVSMLWCRRVDVHSVLKLQGSLIKERPYGLPRGNPKNLDVSSKLQYSAIGGF
jgi:hypothetical protein